MRIRGISKLKRAARRFRNMIVPGNLILMYHSVAEVDSDPWSLSVTPQHFAEQLEVIRKYAHPARLQQLTQEFEAGKHSRRSIVITFDDGYANNLHHAKPLLERYDIPATVFVASGCVESEREFWWDELERLLLQPGALPEKLELQINSTNYQWELGEAAYYSEDDYRQDHSWGTEQQSNPTPRHSLYRSLHQLLQPLLEDERRRILDELLTWAGAEPKGRSTHRSLTKVEVSTLEQGGLLEVGSHTVTHPFLSALPVALQQDEIQQSKAQLEEIIGHPVSSFAYPYGDYTAESTAVVREAGFTCACSCIVNSVQRHTDRFQLPRVEVKDWDGEGFARRLSRWFDV